MTKYYYCCIVILIFMNDCMIHTKAFDNSMAELDSLQEEPYKDSSYIMQLLRDNLAVS